MMGPCEITPPRVGPPVNALDANAQAAAESTGSLSVLKPGGPRTPGGKRRSRRNALRHGLTATTLLDEVLAPGRVDQLRTELRDQFGPRSALERILIDEVARHTAMLELGELAEMAVLRRGALELTKFEPVAADGDPVDAVLTAALASETVERFCRYRRGHEHALVSVLRELREFAARRTLLAPAAPAPPQKKWTEPECAAWLGERAERGQWRCPHCGPATAKWLAGRKALQCRTCRRQTGLRSGTVMAESPLALVVWFEAITAVVANPQISAAELGRQVGIDRPATAQQLTGKIRSAMAADDRDGLLAGLPGDGCAG